MASCRIDYIENLPTATPEEKADLTALHIKIARQLYSHRIESKGFTNKVFSFTGTKLVVLGEATSLNEAKKLVDIINRNEGFEAVKLIQDPENKRRHYASVDVSLASGEEQSIDNINDIHQFYKNYFGDSAIVTDNTDFEDAVEAHEEEFKKITENVMEKASIYLKGLERSGDFYKQGQTEKDLKILISTLKDKSKYGIIEGVSKYILQSSINMKKIQGRLNIIESRLSKLSDKPSIRNKQLKDISDFVRHSSYYYHLFDKLDDIAKEFTTLGINPSAIENYERDLLENDLKEWMQNFGLFSDSEILDFLNVVPSEINDAGRLFTNFKQRYKDKIGGVVLTSEEVDRLQDGMMDILNKNIKKEAGNQQKLENVIKQLRPFKSRLKELHYEVLTEIYYPGFAASFDAGKMAIDGKTPLDEKWKLSKKDFQTMLAIASEDIDAVTMWGSAMINVKETLPATVANYFKDVMIEIDIENKKDIGGLQNFLIKNGRQQGDDVLKNLDSNSTIDNLTIEATEEAPDDFVETEFNSVITLDVLGKTKKFIARKTRNFLNEYNTISYANNRKAFQHTLPEIVDEFTTGLLADRYAYVNLKNSSDAVLRNLYSLMYSDKTGDDLLTNSFGRFMNKTPNHEEIKSRLTAMLWNSFYKEHLVIRSEKEIADIFESNGITDGGELVDLNDDENINARLFALKNAYFLPYRETEYGSTLQDKHYYNPEALFGMKDGSNSKVLVEFVDGTYGYVELVETGIGTILSNTSGKEISQFATFTKAFSKLNDTYKIENGSFGTEGITKWNNINRTDFGKEYFNRLTTLFDQGHSNYAMEALAHREIPQVEKMEESSRIQRAKDTLNRVKENPQEAFMNYASSYLVEENKIPLRRNGVFIDEDGKEVTTPVYVSTEAQYVNGQKIRYIQAKFTKPVVLDRLETDLYKSVLLYKTASNSYRGLKDNESQALLLQTILEGDKTLGLDPRKAKVRKFGTDVKVPGGGVKMKEHDLRTSQMIVSFLNSYIYGIENEDYGILGSKISAKKVAKLVSGYTAFTAMAWNITSIPSNRLISVANTRIMAEGNQWFNDKHWQEARKIYRSNIPKFMGDLGSEKFISQKSMITQLVSRFNAIQGDFLSPQGQIDTQKVGDKIMSSYAYWTSEMVEHMNQTESMIMIMKGFNIEKPDGKSINLWDAIMESNEGRVEGTPIEMPSYFTTEKEIEFQKRLQGVNRQIHGNYQSLDKNMMQKGILTNMIMMFKKYIYDGFRARFMSERYDQELRDEQEGYFRTYINGLNKEFAEIAKTQGMVAALKSEGLKTIGTTLLKSSLAAWDAATFRIASKNNANLSEYLYGKDLSERQLYAAMKATYEMGFVIRAMLMAIVAEAILSGLDDDDEEIAFIMRYVDVYSRRLENDLGFFTSFTNFGTGSYAGATLDQTIKTLKNPMAAVRAFDNTAGVFKQLLDVDFTNDEGNFEMSWGALDKYEKSGNGFEKGDYKIARKLQKSVFSPYYQVVRVADPEVMQQYLNLTQKYQGN